MQSLKTLIHIANLQVVCISYTPDNEMYYLQINIPYVYLNIWQVAHLDIKNLLCHP